MENKNFNKEIKFGNHIQIKRGNGSPQGAKDSFKVGELGYDLTNNDLYIRAESDMVRIGSNIVDTATANSQDLITSHGVSIIKNQIDSDISSLENEVNNLKKSLVDLILPVGTVITNASSTFNPNKVYKGTTWTRIKGRVIVGVDESDNDFKTSGKSGGHKQMQRHNHSGTAVSNGNHKHSFNGSLPSHNHQTPFLDNERVGEGAGGQGLSDRSQPGFAGDVAIWRPSRGLYTMGIEFPTEGDTSVSGKTSNTGSHNHTINIGYSGSGNAENLQPYITKYVWERTA